ncbi:MAG: hypothetical protein ACO2ZN_12615 [Paracoccaceae bacterium]
MRRLTSGRERSFIKISAVLVLETFVGTRSPLFIISETEMDLLIDKLSKSLDEVLGELVPPSQGG